MEARSVNETVRGNCFILLPVAYADQACFYHLAFAFMPLVTKYDPSIYPQFILA